MVKHALKYENFSGRFNLLLDQAGFPAIGAGRAKALANRFGVSKSGAQNWLSKNLPPKRDSLNNIVKEILAELPGSYDPTQVIAWLEYGDAFENPFNTSPRPSPTQNLYSNHVLLIRVYISVHNIAKTKGLDIYSMPDEVLSHIYESVIQKADEENSNEPDEYLISSMLELYKKSQ